MVLWLSKIVSTEVLAKELRCLVLLLILLYFIPTKLLLYFIEFCLVVVNDALELIELLNSRLLFNFEVKDLFFEIYLLFNLVLVDVLNDISYLVLDALLCGGLNYILDFI